MKKKLMALLLAAVIATSGCAQNDNPPENTTLKISVNTPAEISVNTPAEIPVTTEPESERVSLPNPLDGVSQLLCVKEGGNDLSGFSVLDSYGSKVLLSDTIYSDYNFTLALLDTETDKIVTTKMTKNNMTFFTRAVITDDGSVYYIDCDNYTLYRIDSGFENIEVYDYFGVFQSMCVLRDGTVYAVQDGNLTLVSGLFGEISAQTLASVNAISYEGFGDPTRVFVAACDGKNAVCGLEVDLFGNKMFVLSLEYGTYEKVSDYASKIFAFDNEVFFFEEYNNIISPSFVKLDLDNPAEKTTIPMTESAEKAVAYSDGVLFTEIFCLDTSEKLLRAYDFEEDKMLCCFGFGEEQYNAYTAGVFPCQDGLGAVISCDSKTYYYEFDFSSEPVDDQRGESPNIGNIDELCEKIDTELEETYGVNIYYGENCETVFYDYSGVVVTDPMKIYFALAQLDFVLKKLPEDIFTKMLDSEIQSVNYYFVSELCSNNEYNLSTAAGIANTEGDKQILALDISLCDEWILRTNIAHETFHAIDARIGRRGYLEYDYASEEYDYYFFWDSLNPIEFNYTYDYNYDVSGTDEYTYYGGGDVYFVDSYSKVTPLEDRARIFENLFMSACSGYLPDCLSGEQMKDKVGYLCATVRRAFGYDESDGLFWEQYAEEIKPSTYYEEKYRDIYDERMDYMMEHAVG